MYNDLYETIKEIQYLEIKLEKLSKIRNAQNFHNIQIIFFADDVFHTIIQSDTPFSLRNELNLLLNETIEQIEIDIQNLKLNF